MGWPGPGRTREAIDDGLIETARKIGGHRTRKEAVTAALQEYIQHRRQLRILDLVGQVEYDPGHDYKTGRRARRK